MMTPTVYKSHFLTYETIASRGILLNIVEWAFVSGEACPNLACSSYVKIARAHYHLYLRFNVRRFTGIEYCSRLIDFEGILSLFLQKFQSIASG